MHKPYAPIRNAPFPLRRFDTGTTLEVSLDGGAFAPTTDPAVETPAASGVFFNTLTVAEMTADHIAYIGNAGDVRSDGFIIPEPALDSGVAQAGAFGSITLRSGAPSVDLTNCLVEVVRGIGKDQMPRIITAYNTTSKVATVRPNFSTAPDSTSVYKVTPLPKVNEVSQDGYQLASQYQAEFWIRSVKAGTVGVGAGTSVIPTDLSGYGADQFVGCVLQCLGTPNLGIMRPIIAYDTDTGEITVDPPFAAIPTAGDSVHVFGTTG